MQSPDLADSLASAHTIAVVGCSPRAYQTSHRIAQYLLDAGYRVVPINPFHDEILGQTAYPDLQSIPEEVEIDIVNVFRRSEHTEGVVHDAAARAAATGRHPLVWTQLGVHSPEAQAAAEAADLPYVAERCIMVDHRRFLG
ncbi:CoA-binding protein [Rubricoccus marinus]|uniref:CoA-binding protein n=1 Tax=Rubricoccus marinus TaxID=716817 RepID=A0A259U1H8_9BACT|nr:CoA-binding protein [Rubricoccus marinus]OZC03796.1 CoA-binding protein [Rubricoccus marinus]